MALYASSKGTRGYLQADAYAGYDAVYAGGEVIEVACWRMPAASSSTR
jgi:transposase